MLGLLNYEASIENIRQSILKEEYKEAEIVAHSIKGIAGNLGIENLALIAQELETQLKNKEFSKLEEFVEALSEALDSVKESEEHLRKLLELENSSAIENSAHEAKLKLLNELKLGLKSYAPKKIEPLMKELDSHRWTLIQRRFLNELDQQISIYNYTLAVKILEKLAADLQS